MTEEQATPAGAVEQPVTNPLEVPADAMRDEPMPKLSIWRRAWIAVKRSHPVFQLPMFLHTRLLMQDGQGRDLNELARQHVELTKLVKAVQTVLFDHQERLNHHEAGPLKASLADLRARGADGMLSLSKRIVRGNGHHPKHEQRNKPTKAIDAGGNVVDREDQPPPAEAVGDDEDAG